MQIGIYSFAAALTKDRLAISASDRLQRTWLEQVRLFSNEVLTS